MRKIVPNLEAANLFVFENFKAAIPNGTFSRGKSESLTEERKQFMASIIIDKNNIKSKKNH